MRKVYTTHQQVEFHEISNDGVILNIKAFQFGTMHYQIKNGKVVFYANADENPWRNEVWSVDIPVTIDDEVYSTADEVAEALSAVMNSDFQDQLDEFQEGLATEEGRAQAAEEALQTAIENEASRATSAETNLQSEITSVSATVATFDGRIQSCENQVSALTDTVNQEVTRSTAKDASQDALISGLTTSLTNEINRAEGAENSLRSDLNAETSARTTADNSLIQRVTAVEVGKADANNVYTKAESDDKYATKEYMSGFSANYYDKNATDALLADKADKANAVASAEYVSQNKIINFKNISGTVISSIDATAFIKDGMVDNVEISGSNLVITFNTDAGKEPISIPLTDIFNPNNYYTKAETDTAINSATSGKVDTSTFNTLSGRVDTISGEVLTISGDVVTINNNLSTVSGTVETLEREVVTISGDSYSKSEVDTKLGNKADVSAFTAHTADSTVHVTSSEKNTWNAKSDFSGSYNDLTDKPTIPSLEGYATEAYVSGYTYDKQTIDDKVASGGTFDPTQYYTTANTYNKTEVDAAVSGKADSSTVSSLNNVVTAHTADSTVHVTASEKNTWNNKSNFSGSYNDLTDKPTIPSYSAGTNVSITNNVISATDTTYSAGSGITISNNVISAKIWNGTKQQFDAIVTKDPSTLYLVNE